MGLLEKSLGSIDKEINKKTSTPQGLLARAEKLQKKDKNNGLLKKATQLRESSATDDQHVNKTDPDTEDIFENVEGLYEKNQPEPVDMFAEWEKEALDQSSQLQIKEGSSIEPEITSNKFLFDDDSAYSTAPAEFQIASKRKVENYQSIFEITKEIANCNSYEDYYENLTFSILGQMGSESILIFSSTNGNFDTLYVMDFQGIDPESGWNFNVGDEVYTVLKKRNDIVFARELLEKGLPEKEARILRDAKAEILVPLHFKNHFFGIILLGRPLTGEDYTVDDLEFMKIVAEISGSMIEKIFSEEEQLKELKHLKEVIRTNHSVFELSRKIANIKTIDEAFDQFLESIRFQLFVEKFTFYLYDHEKSEQYKIFSSNILSPETIHRYKLPLDSDLVGLVSNVMGVYNLSDYLESAELKKYVSNDEISLMEEFLVLPMINAGWLVGMLVVHGTSVPWTDSSREAAVTIMEIVSPVFANLLMLEEKKLIFSPQFSPVADKIGKEIIKAENTGTDFSIILIKIQNVSRSITMMGPGTFSRYCDSLRRAINETVSDMDHTYKTGQASYCTILQGRNKKEAMIVEKKIMGKISEMAREYDFKVILDKQIVTYRDDAEDKETLLEIIDEF